jgi:hypothetical protein
MMDKDIAGLVERLNFGICDDKCRVRNAASGCICWIAASTIRAQAARITALEESVLLINRVAKDSSVPDAQVFEEAERLARKIKGTEH